KINAGNSWNVAFIDYFHDMSLPRNDDDKSINVQRALCMLDGRIIIATGVVPNRLSNRRSSRGKV
ncbi:hypothetical protein DL96DRAFT_1458559, partial [Flagelloscypha sp. PMI_526]